MGTKTGIEWTDATWNPLRGCSRVSEGCRNCYAESVAYRFSGPGKPYEGLAVLRNGRAGWTGKVELIEKHLLDPLKWEPGRPVYDAATGKRVGRDAAQSLRIFVNSMSDLFHESVPDEWLDRIFAVMALCPQHTFQALTKRPERMLAYMTRPQMAGRIHAAEGHLPGRSAWGNPAPEWPLPNVWLGVSVENQAAADERIPLLLKTPAAVRFISAEPLLGPVNLNEIRYRDEDVDCLWNSLAAYHEVLNSNSMDRCATAEDGVTKLDWVICGGESGAHARPMHLHWARGLRDQCKAAGVPFFFKQWGEWAPIDSPIGNKDDVVRGQRQLVQLDGTHFNRLFLEDIPAGAQWMERQRKHIAGALLDGVEHKAFPEVSHAGD
jgi:protein gp37